MIYIFHKDALQPQLQRTEPRMQAIAKQYAFWMGETIHLTLVPKA